ncbi:CIC11C00000002345 [Sungouiella intermedia]|uniref:CIC11C00000002345 n=1 Tax=Sungouiella intermedia TaxID=45354 RepID=A0A1L0BJE9_9ASCO|nr:CIC11C00000002345 [[Candida] intermedia]
MAFVPELSLFQSVTFRAFFILLLLVLFPYCAYLAIAVLVSNYKPETFGPPPLDDFGFLPEITVDSDLGSAPGSADSLLQALPVSHRISSRYLGSPTPEGDDFLAFNRKLFYQNLNNSSQYLRRDSFS